MAMDILEGLNDRQREAVEAVEGPLLILAGPGSGKTRVITHRIAYLVNACGVSPSRIAAVTFTNKAAREMRERLELLMGPRGRDINAGTFHGFCASILRREVEHVGLNRSFVIYDQEDQIRVIKRAMEMEEIDHQQFSPTAVLSAISSAKSQLIDVATYSMGQSTPLENVIHRSYRRYQELLIRNNAVDFDDLLFSTYSLFKENPSVLDRYQSHYVHLLIDEFQDTNVVQYALACQLAGKYRNICVVGDPDQSIYSWRNADIRNILSFQLDYPEAHMVTLEKNYRSTQTILEAAHKVITSNLRRMDRALHTDNQRGMPVIVSEAYNPEEEAQLVLREVDRLRRDEGYNLADCAVMYRVNAQSRAMEEGCLRYGIPYKLIGGLRFYQRKEVKDIIAYLRVVHNPYDEVSLLRIINVPTRGIGQRTIDHLIQIAQSQGISLYAALQMVAHDAQDQTHSNSLTPRTTRTVAEFLVIVNRLMEKSNDLPVAEMIDAVLEHTGYRAHLMEEGQLGRDRLENVQELRSTSLEFHQMAPEDRLSAFLEGVALVSDIDRLEESKEAITLITLHQAKGLEFPVVFIVGLEDGLLPHIRSMDNPDQMEEERRLFYVGMTRAKERLYMTRAFRRAFRGGSGPNIPSRFLGDIPQNLTSSMETYGRKKVSAERHWASNGEHRQTPAEPTPLKAGERVRHSRFGEGIVVSCVPSYQDHEVTVAFKGDSGIKRLLLSFAPLEKVE